MRKSLYVIFLALLAGFYSGPAWSQCTPGDAITCPDLENNGEVCPDSLQGGITGQLYSHFFTILAPPEYPVNETDTIPLHHITLIDVTNLPPGFTWQSNVANNEFMVGTYYCVLLEGTPPAAGTYDLRITVDVYAPPVLPNTPPLFLGRITDSTSLFLEVIWDPNAVGDHTGDRFTLIEPQPNPFSYHTRVGFQATEPGAVSLKVYDLVGQLCYEEQIQAGTSAGFFRFDGTTLTKGMYIIMVTDGQASFSRRLIRTE